MARGKSSAAVRAQCSSPTPAWPRVGLQLRRGLSAARAARGREHGDPRGPPYPRPRRKPAQQHGDQAAGRVAVPVRRGCRAVPAREPSGRARSAAALRFPSVRHRPFGHLSVFRIIHLETRSALNISLANTYGDEAPYNPLGVRRRHRQFGGTKQPRANPVNRFQDASASGCPRAGPVRSSRTDHFVTTRYPPP
jgi:hypothetical protein